MGQRYGLEIRAATAPDVPGLATLLGDLGGGPMDPTVLAARLDALSKAGGTALIAVEWGPPSGVIALQGMHDLASAKPQASSRPSASPPMHAAAASDVCS